MAMSGSLRHLQAIAFGAALVPNASLAQSTLTTPQTIADLVTTACIFDTRDPDAELPRSHAAFKAAGLPIIAESPHYGFYGDPSGTFFISNLNTDDTISCAGQIAVSDLDKAGFELMVLKIEDLFDERYGKGMFAAGTTTYSYDPNVGYISWLANHGNGTKTIVSVQYSKNVGTEISSVATTDD